AVMHGHPLFPRLDGNANEDAGIAVVIAHLEDHANHAVAELAASPVEQSHAAMRADESVLHRHATGPDMLPAREILAVEKLFPFPRLSGQRKRGQNDCQKKENSATHISPRS